MLVLEKHLLQVIALLNVVQSFSHRSLTLLQSLDHEHFVGVLHRVPAIRKLLF